MMKIAGIILIAVALLTPAMVYAESIKLPFSKNIFSVPATDADNDRSPTVSSFTDNGNRCYILSKHAKYNYPDVQSISCVREE